MSERIYSLLLRLYPLRFRSEYGAEMLQLFRDRLRSETGLKRILLWLDVLADLAVSVLREHRRPSSLFRVVPLLESTKGILKLFLGLAIISELALQGGASPTWIAAIWFLSVDLAFLILLHGWRTRALEYTLDSDGIGFRSDHRSFCILRPEITRITETRSMLVVFSATGAHIPIPTSVSNYSTLRVQLAAWAPIEVLPSNSIPSGILPLAFLATLLLRNPWAVMVLGVAVIAAIVYSTRFPNGRPQMRPSTGWKRWTPPVLAVGVIVGKLVFTLVKTVI